MVSGTKSFFYMTATIMDLMMTGTLLSSRGLYCFSPVDVY
jgi:hypothetical protein